MPPYPLEWDRALVEAGKPLFAQHCGSCHAPDGKQRGMLIPIAEIGTDRELANTQKASGYVADVLDGIWMRGPYLHNGSVPTVGDLLKPSAQRSATFYRGNNLLNNHDVGFVSDLAQEKGLHFVSLRYETAGQQQRRASLWDGPLGSGQESHSRVPENSVSLSA